MSKKTDNTFNSDSETTVNGSYLDLDTSSIENTNNDSFMNQEELYGTILPAPEKLNEPKLLPKLGAELVIPKKRHSNKTVSNPSSPIGKLMTPRAKHKRPSTSGKEGRKFSSPIPIRIASLNESPIPNLSVLKDSKENMTTTPIQEKTKFNSPLAVRSFSTPLADVRSNQMNKTAIQFKLNQLSSIEYLEESERQLKRECLKYESEIGNMKKIKKYRDTKEDEKLSNLIFKWKDVAQKASNYLYNEAHIKINKMGGIEDYRKKQKQSKLRKMKFEYDDNMLYKIVDYMETDEYKNLDKYDKQEILARKVEIEKMGEKIENGEISFGKDEYDEDQEFTMEELYKQMNLDYKLVFNE